MHVRLEADEPRRLVETKIGVASSVWFPRRNGQCRRRRYPPGRDQVLWRITPRIELEADLCALVDRLFAVGVIVEAEAELSAGLEKFGCSIAEDVTIVAPRVLSEQRIRSLSTSSSSASALFAEHRAAGRFALERVDEDVMKNLRVLRYDLHPLDVAVFSQPRGDVNLGILIRGHCRHVESGTGDHQVRLLAEDPRIGRREHSRRRRIGRIAFRRAAVYPSCDGRDLSVAE